MTAAPEGARGRSIKARARMPTAAVDIQPCFPGKVAIFEFKLELYPPFCVARGRVAP